MPLPGRADVVVVGAGIAGVSAAAVLAETHEVVLVEAEDAPARHTTGRSAAIFSENYGNAIVRALTRASRAFLEDPPRGFADVPVLSARGALWIGTDDQQAALDAAAAAGRALVPTIERLDRATALARCPALDPTTVAGAVWEPDARDIDIGALVQGYLRRLRHRGGQLATDAGLQRADWDGETWRVTTAAGDVQAGWIVIAAGAWADDVATRCGVAPIGLMPLRRTAFLFDPPPDTDPRPWPLVIDADESFYFKPESGVLLGSLADETPDVPRDVGPEEVDVALALDRIAVVLRGATRRVRRAWAGLRTFAPDRTPVVGIEPDRAFCWVAGQGGYGIQTAPAIAAAVAGLVGHGRLPDDLTEAGLDASVLSAARFR